MADKNINVPPANLNGIPRGGRGRAVVKPKDMRGTLRRLWALTKGQRKGLGWILLLSGLSSAASVFSPYLTGRIVTKIVNGDAILFVLCLLCGLYFSNWLVRFLQQLLMASMRG